jgi:hypothetical protein
MDHYVHQHQHQLEVFGKMQIPGSHVKQIESKSLRVEVGKNIYILNKLFR